MTQSALPANHAERMDRVRIALDGLSLGDALGERFFQGAVRGHILDDEPYLPPGEWYYSDDTEMALGITDVLSKHGRIDQDDLAKTFARRFRLDPSRGYGPGAIRLLTGLANGGEWRLESKSLFSGMGSFGNGSAMRVAPVGAYFAGDRFEAVAEQARLSAEVTHRHLDGLAGGIAIAVAAAFAWRTRDQPNDASWREALFQTVLAHTPASEVRDRIQHASTVESHLSARSAANLLGNGRRVSCQDTVPFCLWVAATFPKDYPTAIWRTIGVGGDIDTNAAIVGGVVALSTGIEGLPADWLAHRETLKFEV